MYRGLSEKGKLNYNFATIKVVKTILTTSKNYLRFFEMQYKGDAKNPLYMRDEVQAKKSIR